MKDCREFERLIDRVQAGEADDAERERLATHLEECADCGELFDLIDRLADPGGAAEPSEDELAGVRERVLNQLAVDEAELRGRRHAGRFGAWTWTWAAAAGLAGIAFVAGSIFGGRLPGDRPARRAEARLPASDGAALAAQIRTVAAGHAQFEDVENSPYTFSDVRVDRLLGGRVRLSFDVSRHLELELSRRDPLLAEVLMQAMTGASSVGARIEAVDLARALPDRRVERALLIALRHDENLGVRMSALGALARMTPDSEIEQALLDVLSGDPEVPMRLAAIDTLTAGGVDPSRLRHALAAPSAAPQNAVVLARASRYLGRDRLDSGQGGPR